MYKRNVTIKKSMLREPIEEMSKEIILEKKKNANKHPIKVFAELIRRQLD